VPWGRWNGSTISDPSDKPVVEDITAELEEPEHSDVEHGYTSDASTITRDLKAMCQMGEDEEVTPNVALDEAASTALLLRLAGDGADIVLIQEP